KAAARTARVVTSSRPTSNPYTVCSSPAGAPALANADCASTVTAAERRGWPGWALTITGHPVARADAVSPPSTENAKGKFDAAYTATGPTGTSIRLNSGRGGTGPKSA